ncbi:MAG: DNA primase [Candidatus Omnitrophica bacterium]|nr:DNA primase [Candidatus Omnitrophota bacterium]
MFRFQEDKEKVIVGTCADNENAMGMIPQEIIDQILDRIDIVEVISGYIPVKKAGRNFKANCPFHDEKTPSFVISPDKQIYHCFGCSAGGNAIRFIMEYENTGFREAIEGLAARAGVKIPDDRKPGGEGASIASKLYDINKLAADFYHNYLRSDKGKRALDYLKKRGFNSETLSKFKVGFAPEAWDSLRKHCEGKKIPVELLRKAGLTILSEKGKGDYDRFRNRIIFPIFNERGHVVGFGGRVLDDSLPKYINTPETIIYSKSNVLYGLNFSKIGIREKSCAVIVEGYMDVVMPFQYDVTNLVATSGTALTPGQVSMLKKYTGTAVMVFDSDQAGESASLRGLDVLIEKGMNVKIATLPKGEDPDSFVRNNEPGAFYGVIDNAKGLFEYKLDVLIQRLGERNIGGIVDEMLPTITKVDNAVVQSDYLRRLAERLGVHEASLRHEMGKVKPDYSYHYETEEKPDKKSYNYKNSELHLLGLAVLDKKLFLRMREELAPGEFQDSSIKKIIDVVGELFDKGEDRINPGKLLSRFQQDEPAREALVKALAKAEITQDPGKALIDCIFCVRKENKEDKLKGLTLRLKKAQESSDDAEVKKLLVEINKLHKEKVV